MIFLVQSAHPWRGIRQRPHHLMERFARHGHRVLWAESRYLRWLIDRRGDFLRMRAESPTPGLQVRPVTLVNGERFAPVRNMNKSRLTRALNAPVAETRAAETDIAPHKNEPRVLWIYNPHEGHLADTVPHDLLIYDIMDEYRGFPWAPPNIVAEEEALLRRADWVFAGTQALYDARQPLAEEKIECILSGVETDRFAEGDPDRLADPEFTRLRRCYRKMAGYAGMVDLRIDRDLLARAARAMPDWGFVLIGPVAEAMSELEGIKNIHLLGARPYEDLPHYYKAWDAALLPFVHNSVTAHINPTKMLEYGAAGTPIVARALPDVARFYSDGARLYETPAEFIEHLKTIDTATAEAQAPTLANARAWADERSWDALANRMLDRVKEL